ncbi:uncharacterized protein PGTG_06731 [Puccinia graminis f. sp. tritici CRL 75-36-700-3]|uniref:COG complex component COG2 C-terminal domain-containing protein n=1 Tax=Puccinia graminis f. sp. tritici (strain CRL 75-36-700-3 / race SCCL) TaxID=418459 RepID=E3K8M4_PUCGT|nr:uncharacterized protein PGTG_06731 [Puccinia graminis f. sp. tritici CRL 75-36-700-3]EFP80775.2 hypothetical protein PGTG_06731 [Puccinia graminis f. sp. tritici CRL 75-36-700-3]
MRSRAYNLVHRKETLPLDEVHVPRPLEGNPSAGRGTRASSIGRKPFRWTRYMYLVHWKETLPLDEETLPLDEVHVPRPSEGKAPQLTSEIRQTLVKRCSEKLRFIRSVGLSARASKTIPTEPSYFISDILNDIQVYLEKYGKNLTEQVRTNLVSGIIDELSAKYLAILINVQRSEDSLRKLKKGKHGFSIFNRNSNSDSNKAAPLVEDDELKVKVQLRLDVERLELDSIRLGADLSSSKSFLELKETVSK